MLAVKDNKEYTVTDLDKGFYLNEGYDILNEKGEIIEYSPKKMIKFSEYMKVSKELEKLKAKAGDDSKVKELTESNESLTKANSELTKANEELKANIAKLEKESKK